MISATIDKNDYQRMWQQRQLHLLQSWHWGEVKRPEWFPMRLVVDEQFPVQVLLRKLPITGKRIAYLPRFAGIEKAKFEELLAFLYESRRVEIVLVDPDFDTEQEFLELGEYEHQVQPQYTNQVNLTISTDDLWQKLDANYRRNINKSKRQGVEIVKVDFDNPDTVHLLDEFDSVMRSVAKQTKFTGITRHYINKLWSNLFSPHLCKVYLAVVGGQTVGGYLVVFDEIGAYELYGGVASQGRMVEAGYLLKWEAILDAQTMGKQLYDHWGIADFAQDEQGKYHYNKRHPLANISKFKEGFGGKPREFAAGRIFYLSLSGKFAYQLVAKLKTIRIWIKGNLKI